MTDKKLYIAEDNLEFSDYLATVAKREGWLVETCVNGDELLALLYEGSDPALALIDINMPEKDGIQVVEALSDLTRPLRFRFMTGGADAPILAAMLMARARSLSVGRNLYKPIPMETWIAVLNDEGEALVQLEDYPQLSAL
ncbi:response regulator [Pseudophaeobacter sp.]|uniref:response regulator n=1 Tax=Pseudophaeobacter sp. TaxID=1971739 RepID=UPI004058FDB1